MERRKRARVRHQEEALLAHLAELKVDLANKDAHAAAKLGSSLGRVKSFEEYGRDRERTLQALLQVPNARQLHIHHDVMQKELAACSQPAYTTHNLPFILHQFYLQRVSQLVQMKHMLMVRWARFGNSQSKVAEELYHHFHERIEYLMSEYNDSLHRARRLAASHEGHVTNKTTPTTTISSDDVMIYLRWLVTTQHNTKMAAAFLTKICWFPSLYHKEFSTILCSPAKSQQTTKQTPLPMPCTKWLNATKDHPSAASHTDSVSHTLTSNHTHFTFGSVTKDHVTSHMTVASSLGEGGALRLGLVGVVSGMVPLHTTDTTRLKESLQELMMRYGIRGSSSVHSPADQLKLFYESSQKFLSVFSQQEHLLQLPPYDSAVEEEGKGGGGIGGRGGAFQKPANWIDFIQIRPEPDPVQITAYAEIRDYVSDTDPLLLLSSLCTHLHHPQRVKFALSQHAHITRHPSTLPPLTPHKSHDDIAVVWKSVYLGLDNRNPMSTDDLDMPERDAADEASDRGSSSNLDPLLDVGEAMQVIHSTEGRDVSSKASAVAKDSYFSYLLLRHLKIREMRMICRSILNYFRSVERTLTINHQGLSLESGHQQPSCSGGLLSHGHLHNTPTDYVISEVKFMQFTEVENHDDFYSFPAGTEKGPVGVWDQQGVEVVYDVSLEDLQRLEKELLTVGTYYIQRSGGRGGGGGGGGGGEGGRKEDMADYSRREVDRFAVLHDLWTSEASYLHHKMKVVNSYLECYHHVSDRKERAKLAEVITTLIWSRPRYDPNSAYFTATFDLECQCLEAQQHLVRGMANSLMEEERAHTEILWEGKSRKAHHNSFGLPLPPPPDFMVSLTGHKHLLSPSSLLETCSSLSVLSSFPQALNISLKELAHTHKVTSPTHILTLHHKLLEVCLVEWEERRHLGTGFSSDTTHNVFFDGCVEDPHTMCQLCEEYCSVREREEGRGGGEGGEGRSKQEARLQAWCDVLQLISLRHHLLLTCTESHLLTQHYKQLLKLFNHEECHAHLRCVTYDPSMKLPTEKPLEFFILKAKESNPLTRLDRYTPSQCGLAVAELDDKHMNFSFRSKEDIKKILTTRHGLLKLQTAVKAQVSHKCTLAITCIMNSMVLQLLESVEGEKKPISSVSSLTPPTPGAMSTTASQVGQNIFLKKSLQRAFVSLQCEKVPVRDHMLAWISGKAQSVGRSQLEMERVKCSAIGQFSDNLMNNMAHYSLRAQIIQLCNSLLHLLSAFPATRDTFFTVGQLSSSERPTVGTTPDSRQHRARPPALLTKDGSRVLNLWYIPHASEVLTMFSGEAPERSLKALKTVLSLLSPLLTLLLYHTSYVRLGRSATGGTATVGGDWGGTEGVGSVVQQLQSSMSSLPDPSHPQQVSEYLQASCELLYLEHTLTVEHYLQRTFLLHGNQEAIRMLRFISIPAVCRLSTASSPCHLSYPSLTTPSLPPDQSGLIPTLLPWQHFLSTCGPAPSLLEHCWEVGEWVYVSIATLQPEDRTTANAEMLGLSLLLEETVQIHEPGTEALHHLTLPTSHHPHSSLPPSRKMSMRSAGKNDLPPSLSQSSLTSSFSRGASSAKGRPSLSHPSPSSSSSTHLPPMEAVKQLHKFLQLSLQLERLRQEWSLQAVGGAHSVSTQQQCQQLELAYQERVVGVARKAVAKQLVHEQAKMAVEGEALDESFSHSTTFLTEGISGDASSADEFLQQSNGISEMRLREAQVSRLLELLELWMIHDTIRHVAALHHLMLAERHRDEATLPLDLWKTSPSMKEPTGVPRPHIVADFLSQFQSSSTDMGPAYTIPKVTFRECVHQLSSGVLAREKECFQIYASHYEGLIRSLYNQLYQRERQLELWQSKVEGAALSNQREALVTAGELTQSLLLEITALRVRIKQLEKQLQTQESQLREQILQEYSSLTHGLLSTCTTIKSRYEDYRSRLYSDVLQCVQEVRQSAAVGVAKMKDQLSDPTRHDAAMTTKLKGDDVCNVQEENAQLNGLLIKQRSLHHLKDRERATSWEREVSEVRRELDEVRKKAVEEKMRGDTERESMTVQMDTLRKRLRAMQKEAEATQRELEEMRKKPSAVKQATKRSKHHVPHKTMTTVSSKRQQLLQDLEEKEKQIKILESSQERQQQEGEVEQRKMAKSLHLTRQQLEHERHLKREAFHQVDELLGQVHDLEEQQHVSLRALQQHSRSPTPHGLPSRRRMSTPSSLSSSRTTPNQSTSHSRPESRQQRPKSQQSHRPSTTSSEMIDLSQEILALKLI